MVESTPQPSMSYAPTYYQNRDKAIAVQSHYPSSERRSQDSVPLPAPRAIPPASHLTEKYYASRDPFNREHKPQSPVSTASYSRNTSLAEHTPIQIPSPTYSQSSRAEQGYYGRDVNSRSGMMVNDYGQMSMQSAIAGSPDYIFTRHEDAESMDDATSNHAVWLLTWLSCLLPLFTLFCAIYSLLSILAILLLSPLQLCGLIRSVPTTTEYYLSPLWRTQLRVIYSPKLDDEYEIRSKPLMLLIVHLAAPILSFGVALAAWVAASFWLFALIMGNPDGTERGDDGRNTVILVRNWWEKWLLKAAR